MGLFVAAGMVSEDGAEGVLLGLACGDGATYHADASDDHQRAILLVTNELGFEQHDVTISLDENF